MLFALIDYWKYRRRTGRYSHAHLEAKGFSLATKENFSNYDSYVPGDILFASTTNSALSWAVMYCTDSTVSHTAMFYGNGIVHDCTTSGVVRHSFANYLDGQSYLCVKRIQGNIDRQDLRSIMDKTLGDGYNWRGVRSLFFHILIGNHQDFAWRLAADFLLLLVMLWGVSRLLAPQADYVFGAVAGAYLAVVAMNRVFLKKTAQLE